MLIAGTLRIKVLFSLSIILLILNTNPIMAQKKQHTNKLIDSTSPYLQQHAHNPVNWYPWGKEALEKSKKEDKPILLSIGYSSCHWCHVMEKESFENDSIAKIMNDHFICIKVDREERPDIDQIYMDAIQTMGQNGGWPLNVFLTPDQDPFYGGTYFPPAQWAQLLRAVAKTYQEKKDEIIKSAQGYTKSVSTSELEKYGFEPTKNDFSMDDLKPIYHRFAAAFDHDHGGLKKSPKFPMPSHWRFCLLYYSLSGDKTAYDQAYLTLSRMAFGGIFDQVGGGFARYSVDGEWFAPHFEKMLYDNGQLMQLYSEAYQLTGSNDFKQTVYQIKAWLDHEMTHKNGGFYSALDADSEGVEGKFYTWTWGELQFLEKDELQFMKDYFQVTEEGNWEDGMNILHPDLSPAVWAGKNGLSPAATSEMLVNVKEKLFLRREQKIRPGLDDKILSGWNALMNLGLTSAYAATGDSAFLETAEANANFILENMMKGPELYRSYKNGAVSGTAYLEDYALWISAFLSLYEKSFDQKYLEKARLMTDYVLDHFQEKESGMFYYTSNKSEALIARKTEIFDNVIPSSNAIMADNLYRLGKLFDLEDMTSHSAKMVSTMAQTMKTEPFYLTHWIQVLAKHSSPTAEIIIVGPKYLEMAAELERNYLPNKIIMASEKEGKLPLMEGKVAKNDQTTIYVCYNKTCKLPVQSIKSALEQLR